MASPAIEQSSAGSVKGSHSKETRGKVLSVVEGKIQSDSIPTQPQQYGAPSIVREIFPVREGAYVLFHSGVARPTAIQAIRENDQIICKGQDGIRFSEMVEGQVFIGPLEDPLNDEKIIRGVALRPTVPVSTQIEDKLEEELTDVYGKLDATEKELSLLKKHQAENPLITKVEALKKALTKAESRVQDLSQRASVSEEELDLSLRENDALAVKFEKVNAEIILLQKKLSDQPQGTAMSGAQLNALANLKTLLLHAKLSSNTDEGRAVFQNYLDDLDS